MVALKTFTESELASLTARSFNSSSIAIATTSAEETLPAVAFDGANYLVAWQSDTGIRATRVRESDGALLDGTASSGGLELLAPQGAFRKPIIAYSNDTYLVAWSGTSGLSQAAIGQRVRASDGSLLNSSADVWASRYVTDLAAVGGTNSYLLQWQTYAGISFALGGVHVDGTALTGLNPNMLHFPSLTFDGTNFLITTIESGSVVGQRVREADGTGLDSAGLIQVATTVATGASIAPRSAFDGSHFLVAWDDSRGGTYLARVRPSDGALLDGTFNGSRWLPSVTNRRSGCRIKQWRKGHNRRNSACKGVLH